MTLAQLYQSKLYNYVKARETYLMDNKSQKITNPLFISDTCLEEFRSGDIRIMFFGQETNGWQKKEQLEVKPLQKAYDDFYRSNKCFSYGGQFWNGINRFKTLLKEEFPKRKIEYLWNNIIKVGKQRKGRPNDSILKIEREHLNVIPDEIKIAKPNVIVFFTGPTRDDILNTISNIENKQKIEKFTERQLVKLFISEQYLSYRTYHPNFLWRNDIDSFLKAIVSDIKRNIKFDK